MVSCGFHSFEEAEAELVQVYHSLNAGPRTVLDGRATEYVRIYNPQNRISEPLSVYRVA